MFTGRQILVGVRCSAAFVVLSLVAGACVTGSIQNESQEDGSSSPSSASPDVAVVERSKIDPKIKIQRVELPQVPPIVLPDLSELSEIGSLLDQELDELIVTDSGLEVVSASCPGGENEFAYHSEQGSFLEIETDGSGKYLDQSGDGQLVIEVAADGSGKYLDQRGRGQLIIEVAADGSGKYLDQQREGGQLLIEVDSEGNGEYSDASGRTPNLTVSADGSGTWRRRTEGGQVSVSVGGDGSGKYVDQSQPSGQLVIEVKPDGSRRHQDTTGPSGQLVIEVAVDGSGKYLDQRGGDQLLIEVDSAGSGKYSHGTSVVEFTTDEGILDPELVRIEFPEFGRAPEFPKLATLGSLEPPCVSIVRLDSGVLFDFDSDQLRPEANEVLDEIADALIETGEDLEIHGHTDSKGEDDYNQDLSERRAASVERSLIERGVTAEIKSQGFGETRPLTDNENPDGSDNPIGRQQNRRVEIIIRG